MKKKKTERQLKHHTKTQTRRRQTTDISFIAPSSFEDKEQKSENVKIDQKHTNKQKTPKEQTNADNGKT